jgi:xylulokinase
LIALPYFKGERTPIYDPDAKGVIFGLTLNHTRADIYRALLEGVGFGLRHNIDAMQAEGVKPKRILGIGGGTKNLGWMQIICDIVNVSMSIPEVKLGASYGDAIMAGVGVGVFKDLNEIANQVKPERIIQPREDVYQQYQRQYSIYRELYTHTRELMHQLACV